MGWLNLSFINNLKKGRIKMKMVLNVRNVIGLFVILFVASVSTQARSEDLKPLTITEDKCVQLCLGIGFGSEAACAVVVPALCGALNLWNAEIGFFPCTAVAEAACAGGSGGVDAMCTGICSALSTKSSANGIPGFPLTPAKGILFK